MGRSLHLQFDSEADKFGGKECVYLKKGVSCKPRALTVIKANNSSVSGEVRAMTIILNLFITILLLSLHVPITSFHSQQMQMEEPVMALHLC